MLIAHRVVGADRQSSVGSSMYAAGGDGRGCSVHANFDGFGPLSLVRCGLVFGGAQAVRHWLQPAVLTALQLAPVFAFCILLVCLQPTSLGMLRCEDAGCGALMPTHTHTECTGKCRRRKQ